MSQISKKLIKGALGAGAFIAQTGGTAFAEEASTVVRTSGAGDGTTRYQPQTTQPTVSDADVAKINEEIRSLSDNSNGLVHVGGVSPTDTTIGDTQASLSELRALIAQYNSVKQALDAQVANNVELSPGTDNAVSLNVPITGTYAEIVNELQDTITQMNNLKEYNQAIIDGNALSSSTNQAALVDAITEANNEIKQASKVSNHAGDGVIGNFDDVVRASYDSKQVGVITSADGPKSGVVVDTKAIDSGNTVTSTTEYAPVRVRTIEELNTKKQEALRQIGESQSNKSEANVTFGEYKDNSIQNIGTTNTWLQEKQNDADSTQAMLDAKLTADDGIDEYKQTLATRLQELKTSVTNTQTTADKTAMLAAIDAAIANINNSSVTQTPTSNINMLENVDFEDIGVDPALIDAKIAELNASYDSAVSSATQKFLASNDAANAAIQSATGTATASLDTFEATFAQFLSEQAQYDKEKAAIDSSNREVMEAKGLTWTGDYATDKAAVDAWNAENAGKSSSGTGLMVTPNTTYEKVGGSGTESTPTASMMRLIFQEGAPDKMWIVPPGESITIKVSNTSHGNVTMTFSNVHHGADGWEGIKPWVVGIYDDGAGAIAYALGTLASGQNAGGNSEGGSVGGGGTINNAPGYLQSFDVHVVTDATDIQEFTYNDIDNTQRVTIKSGMGSATVRNGSNIQQSGTTFIGTAGNVDQGRDGVLGSNSFGLSYDTPQKIDLTLHHRYPGADGRPYSYDYGDEYFNIIAGIFGSSSEVKAKPIAIQTLPTPPTPPVLTVSPVNVTVETFTVSDPSAVAHAEGNYENSNKIVQFYTRPVLANGAGIQNLSASVVIPILLESDPTTATPKLASSSTSFIVKQLKDEIKKTASGNSLTVRTNPISKATASGNSMVLKVLSREKLTASSNSMITRVLQPAKTLTTNNATNTVVQALVAAKKPVTVTENTVNISAYADEAIAPVVNTAIQKWATALKYNGLTLDYTVTSDKAALEKGVTIAFLDADDETTRGNMGLATIGVEDDKEMEFSSLAGLSMSASTIQLVDLTGQDKLNKDGSITNGNVLKNAQYIVQLNTEGITTSKDQTNVVTHEIGHIFGLYHDDSDSLMTTYYDDADFTGEISSVDDKLAVAYILDKIKK